MVVGEGMPYLTALVVLNDEQWISAAKKLGVSAYSYHSFSENRVQDYILERISQHLHAFPGHIKVLKVAVLSEPWTVENGLLTPTLKVRRNHVLQQHKRQVDKLYEGH